MTAKGTPDWYRDRRAGASRLTSDERREMARAAGMFDEETERPAFEAFFKDSRRNRGAAKRATLLARMPSGDYVDDHTQRHWWTWQIAVGGGRLLPPLDHVKFGLYYLGAERKTPGFLQVGTVDVKHEGGPLRRFSLKNGAHDNLADGTYDLYAAIPGRARQGETGSAGATDSTTS